ncbi:unnamed protein product [Orchesella dallaii]|uniref:UDP-glucuronosyltransferase n=1 Tax=Orchesella dallaii TaxID=48710 RepID=A0ABP1R4P3_9HEXA
MKILYFLPLLLLLLSTFTTAHRILTLLLVAGRSNMNYFDPIHYELAKKGHQITVISPTPGLVKHPNIKELPGLDFSKMVQGMIKEETFFEMRLAGERMASPFLIEKFTRDCDAFHQLPSIQKIIKDQENKAENQFDLVMTMAFMNECVYGLFHHLNASSVIISTVPAVPWIAGITGAPTILSFVPDPYFIGVTEMNFFERLRNFGALSYQIFTRDLIYLPVMEETYQKYIPNAPNFHEIAKNVSLVLGAGHPSFGPLRPTMPDLIDDIGGLHCRPANPLPKEINQLILNEKGEPQDFIFFSLGSIVQGHQLPDSIRNAILKTFGKFQNYKILWKWEVELNKTEEILQNVKTSKWFPQQDVLGHPNCKLFITHGGLSSLHESIYHGVPVIGIPFFGDQDWNVAQVEYYGIGLKLELTDITEGALTTKIEEVLTNPRYREEVKRRSILFKDRQNSPLEKSVWSIEYVLRHGGAPHLRSPARNLGYLQYYCVDIILFIFVSFLITLYAISFSLRKIVSCMFSTPTKKKSE